ncbi:MAG TPA: methyl-accepting chemotaxis protein [Candidatus Nitrosopelagicus sp.]|nr:methyl-accepting chemotaxis protein [Candidatus Nitrosopelagicus sp.]
MILTPVLLENSFAIDPDNKLDTFTNRQVFAPGEPLFVYGNSIADSPVLIRLSSPNDNIIHFEQVITKNDGSFHYFVMNWPNVTESTPYGTYILEVISENGAVSDEINLKFTGSSSLVNVPIERNVSTVVFAPETAAINNAFRIYVQTSSDGLLIGNNPSEILGTSHVHLPNGQVQSLEESLLMLHQGLYYVDYLPALEGTHVFHMVTFDQGNISHGSAATNVLIEDISGISRQIIALNQSLVETSDELKKLKSETSGFGSTLENASSNIDESVSTISTSVANMEEGSSQLNSLLFPIVASIAIILALQIVIIARRR